MNTNRPSGRLWPALVFSLLIAAFFSVTSYPGFMSFDSVEALRQARGSVEGSQYPPFGSYIWRVLDWVWPGPTLMQLFQNGLLLSAFAWTLWSLRWPWLLQVVALLAVGLFPPFTGTMLVVWKDVAVAAFYLSGFAVLFHVRESGLEGRKGLVLFAILLIFFGMAYRFNAASGALPLVIYATWLLYGATNGYRSWAKAVVRGFAFLVAMFALVWLVNSYRFPMFERLERNTNMDSIMRFDLVGISNFSGMSVVPGRDGLPIDIDYLQKIYDPRHLNITSVNDVEKLLPEKTPEMSAVWGSAISDYPLAYLRHRSEVFREYIGMHGHEVFYVTHPAVDQNALGITHTPSALTHRVIAYVWKFRSSMVDRPWVYYLGAMLALTAMCVLRVRIYRVEATVVLASGLLYLAPMYFITPAGDLRYNFWSLWATLLCVVFVITGFLSSQRGLSAAAFVVHSKKNST